MNLFHIVKNLPPPLDPKSLVTDFEKESIIIVYNIYPDKTIIMNPHTSFSFYWQTIFHCMGIAHFFLFIGGYLLHNIALVSATQQHEPA